MIPLEITTIGKNLKLTLNLHVVARIPQIWYRSVGQRSRDVFKEREKVSTSEGILDKWIIHTRWIFGVSSNLRMTSESLMPTAGETFPKHRWKTWVWDALSSRIQRTLLVHQSSGSAFWNFEELFFACSLRYKDEFYVTKWQGFWKHFLWRK